LSVAVIAAAAAAAAPVCGYDDKRLRCSWSQGNRHEMSPDRRRNLSGTLFLAVVVASHCAQAPLS